MNFRIKKQPVERPAFLELLLPLPAQDSAFHPVIFDALDGSVIYLIALWTKGAAGPSGLDVHGWKVEKICVLLFREPRMIYVYKGLASVA